MLGLSWPCFRDLGYQLREAGETLAPVDLQSQRNRLQQRLPRPVTDEDLAAYLMYPRVWEYYARDRLLYGDPAILPTTVFFYGMEPG